MKRALIFGITGQDGSYLAEVLLEKGYAVHGVYRRSATGNTRNVDHLIGRVTLHKGDLADTTSIYRIIRDVAPTEIYNEADQDHVSWSFAAPDYSFDITGSAVGRMLEAVRQIDSAIKVFQPCTSHMFGTSEISPQNEKTPFNPQSPYACSKVLAYYLMRPRLEELLDLNPRRAFVNLYNLWLMLTCTTSNRMSPIEVVTCVWFSLNPTSPRRQPP